MRATRVSGAARPVTQPRRTSDRALRSTFATNMALAGLAVITGIPVARLLGPAGEGELTAIQTWPLLLGTLAMLGLDSALVYFICAPAREGQAVHVNSRPHRSPVIPRRGCCCVVCAAVPSSGATAASSLGGARIPPDRSDLRGSWHSPRILAWCRRIHRVESISPRSRPSLAVHTPYFVAPGAPYAPYFFPGGILGGILVSGLPFLFVVNRKLRGPLKPDCQTSARNVALRTSLGAHVASADHQSPIGSAADHRISPGSDTGSLCCRGGLEWRGRSAADSRGICPVPPCVG